LQEINNFYQKIQQFLFFDKIMDLTKRNWQLCRTKHSFPF